MSSQNLRALFVEASQDDLQQTLAKLVHHDFLVEYLCVQDADAMKSALLTYQWDVVLCSYNPPAFGGLEALNLLQSLNLDVPFLFLSHNLREENIIQAIQAGAGDYLFKGNLERLIPAIEHYLREATIRREHRQMLLDLKENQTRLHALIAHLPGMAYQILRTLSGEITFPYVSEGSYDLLGTQPQELERNPQLFFGMLHPDDADSYHTAMLASAQNLSFVYWEGRIKSAADGAIKWLSLRCSPRSLPQGTQWEGMMFDITERKLAEIEILRSQEQLRELSAHIQDVREQERLALAREVHDDMGSMLTAIKLDVAWLGRRLDKGEAALHEKISDIEILVSKCAEAASNIARNLRPSALDSFGIIAAIEIETREFEQRTGIPCSIESVDKGEEVTPNIAITLFRIYQEALNNIIKHAHASKVTVAIYNRKHNIELTVKDNGRGLDEPDRLKPRSFGLRGIKERVARFGGEVHISGSLGQGTSIKVTLPHSAAETLPQQTLF
jgi:signal transduction histidine kinase/CheY-like chemotaxis protein